MLAVATLLLIPGPSLVLVMAYPEFVSSVGKHRKVAAQLIVGSLILDFGAVPLGVLALTGNLVATVGFGAGNMADVMLMLCVAALVIERRSPHSSTQNNRWKAVEALAMMSLTAAALMLYAGYRNLGTYTRPSTQSGFEILLSAGAVAIVALAVPVWILVQRMRRRIPRR
jgi:hypothetical protein